MSDINDENDSTQANTLSQLDLTQLLQSQPTYKNVDKSTLVSFMRTAWINERSSTDLLLYEDGIVDQCKEKLQEIEDQICDLQAAQTSHNVITDMMYTMRRCECERLRYMLHDYLRCRLKKIELYTLYVFVNKHVYDTLSPAEQSFCRGLLDLWGEHADNVLLSRLLSDKFKNLTNSKMENHADMAAAPDIHTFSFMQVIDDIGVVQLADDDEVELNKGDIVLASYSTFKDFMAQDKVEMI